MNGFTLLPFNTLSSSFGYASKFDGPDSGWVISIATLIRWTEDHALLPYPPVKRARYNLFSKSTALKRRTHDVRQSPPSKRRRRVVNPPNHSSLLGK